MRGAVFLLGIASAAGCAGTCTRKADSVAVAEAVADAGAEAGAVAITEADAETGHRMASSSGRELCVRAVRRRSLGEPRCAAMQRPIEQAVWIDHDHVAALLEGGAVVVLGPDGVSKDIGLPEERAWARPPPRDEKGRTKVGAERVMKAHLRRGAPGELFLARCPWWFFFDAGWCDQWVEAMLLPTPIEPLDRADAPPGFKEPHTALPSGTPPAGVTLSVEEPDGGGDVVVTCERGAQSFRRVEPSQGASLSVDWAWIGESPSSFVLRVELDHGEGTSTTLQWMEACKSEPVRELHEIVAGPGLLWIHDDPRGYVVRDGEREIGVVEGDWADFAP